MVAGLPALAASAGRELGRLPYSIRVLLENALRHCGRGVVREQDVMALLDWNACADVRPELAFMPARVLLQDFTGVPCVVDLAAMRSAVARRGGDPSVIDPSVPVDLVIDHSVQVDFSGMSDACQRNMDLEMKRNAERYALLRWAQGEFGNLRVAPPGTGICHQVNLEYLAEVVRRGLPAAGADACAPDAPQWAYADTVIGTDSHTTMINGLGVLGWGVGGIEAEAVMLGQPYYMLPPEVIGFKLTGKLPEGATATDLVLTVTQMLRKKGVVEKFVEFFGPGMAALSVPDRATIANMAPEYGATVGFFPIDAKTIDYLRFTGRDEQAALTEAYAKANMLWHDEKTPAPVFTDVMELDLSTVQPSLAGPKRPQDRVRLADMKSAWLKELADSYGKKTAAEAVRVDTWASEGGEAHAAVNAPGGKPACDRGIVKHADGTTSVISHGAVVIAAITSCTNTSNPDVLIAAGLVARKARALGLTRKPWVKTSLAPGSKVVTEYLNKANLTADLDALGFNTVGYGCTTCIGNSGPLPDEVEVAIKEGDLVAASVLSGNRNFEGRVHPSVKANYLASPPLCVAYAIAGSVGIDLVTEPLAKTRDGKPVFLKDIWPTHAEIQAVKAQCLTPGQFKEQYSKVFSANETWNKVPVSKSELYSWNAKSTYIQNPPYFDGMKLKPAEGRLPNITGARCLVQVADSVTTDHISPAGDIAEAGPAGEYLKSLGVPRSMFNSYGARRGNDRVMTRGTFANIRVKNKIAEENGKIKEGWWTRDFSKKGAGQLSTIFDASLHYKAEGTPLIVLAGKDYGMGSSRDWAAKGAMLLGVKAVISESFERIHRSNLVGMGVLPLNFKPGQTAESLGLCGTDIFDIELPAELEPRCEVKVTATITQGAKKGEKIVFNAVCRLDSAVEINYYRNGGILQTVLRKLLNESKKPAMAGA
jgi:aconitate hydratase